LQADGGKIATTRVRRRNGGDAALVHATARAEGDLNHPARWLRHQLNNSILKYEK
jgi:hypothetical protein